MSEDPHESGGRRAALVCGRDSEALINQVADGDPAPVDDHQRGCPHCQAALAEFDRLWNPVRMVAADRPQAPAGMLDEALRHIREVTEDPEYGRVTQTFGDTRISARVVVILARQLASEVEGVRVALSDLVAAGAGVIDPAAPTSTQRRGHGPEAVAGVAGGSTVVEITLAADYGQDLAALATRIRMVVSAGVRAYTGLEPVAVSVLIDDVFT